MEDTDLFKRVGAAVRETLERFGVDDVPDYASDRDFGERMVRELAYAQLKVVRARDE